LNKAASRRHRLLNEAIQLFRFINECRNFEEWSNSIRSGLQESTPIEHVEASRNKFDKLKSEMNVNGKTQLNNTNKMADELIGQGEDHSKIDEVKACRRQMNTLWTELQHLHEAKSEELGRLTRLVEFREMCTDTRSWMTEKFSLLGKTSPTENMKELQVQATFCLSQICFYIIMHI
jgi:spectrin beta